MTTPVPRSARRFVRRLVALGAIFSLGLSASTPAHALALLDPSGTYEAVCYTGPSLHPFPCEDQPTPQPIRARARIHARQFQPPDCSSPSCTAAGAQLEGQIIVPRAYDQGPTWDEAAQMCKFPPDHDPYTWIGDVYDVTGEFSWWDLQYGQNTVQLGGEIVSDPGPSTYIPKMKFDGGMLLPTIPFLSFQKSACLAMVGTPALHLVMSFDAPPENDPPPQCTTGSGYHSPNCWRRIAGPAPSLAGSIRGKAASTVPTYTETGYEVHHATVVVYEQLGGRVREQLFGESDSAYREFLVAQGRKEIRRVQVERRRDGTDVFGSPGRFEFGDLPIFHFQDHAAGRWGTVWYTVEVESAETDEQVPLEGGGTVTSRLLFQDGQSVNVRPEEDDVVVGLEPFGDIGVKRRLIERLSQACVLHYAPVEEAASAFLDTVEAGALTPELDEAVRRGAWAERSVLGARVLAEEMIETSLAGLAKLLADLYGDLMEFHRGDIAFQRSSRQRLSAPADPLAAASFKVSTSSLSNTTRHAISGSGSSQLLARSDLASTAKKAIKGAKPLLVAGLVKAGVENAESVAGTILLGVTIVADGIETRTLAGGGKALVKLLIAEAIQEAKPILLDVTPLSYCGLTDATLESSVEHMATWNTDNDDLYTKDRRDVVQVLGKMNTEASNVLARMRAAQEVAAGFDTVQSAAGATGTVFKFAKAIEKFAMLTKYALNGESVVLPFVQAFGRLPVHLEDAVARSYGLVSLDSGQATGSRAASSSALAGASLVVTPNSAALAAILSDMDAALADDRIGDLIELLAGEEELSYVAARAEYDRAAEALFAQAAAAAGAYGLDAPLRGANDAWLAALTTHAELADLLRHLVVDVYSGEYGDVDDEGYARAKQTAQALIGVLLDRLSDADTQLSALKASVESNTFGAAVLIEALAPVSLATGESFVSQSPETFTFEARVTNLSSNPLAGLSLRAIVTSPQDSVQVAGAAEKPVGSLQPLDGLGNGGADEAIVQWQVTYSGDFAWELLQVGAELLQDGEEPDGIVADPSSVVLPIDASVADSDGDGLPDDFEAEYGLAIGAKDALADPDDDDLGNLDELRLGTDPSDADTDDDGASDGDEALPGAGGFATNPLVADTDGDGTNDGADGDPLDASTTSPPVAAGEPAVAVSTTLVTLTPASPVGVVTVSNAGSGTLLWSAVRETASLLEISPSLLDVRGEGDMLIVTVPDGVDLEAPGAIATSILVTDAAGNTHDSRRVQVVFGADTEAAVCGHGTDASIGARVAASDALATLRAAVGTITCAPCRCDIDSSGKVTAGDALQVLRAAVGIPVSLSCPPCG